ncbi:unnamed protein product, partial [Oncorhynchus mykiss]
LALFNFLFLIPLVLEQKAGLHLETNGITNGVPEPTQSVSAPPNLHPFFGEVSNLSESQSTHPPSLKREVCLTFDWHTLFIPPSPEQTSFSFTPRPKENGLSSQQMDDLFDILLKSGAWLLQHSAFCSNAPSHLWDYHFFFNRTITQHTSRLCKGCLTKKESEGVLHQMPWPPQSTVLNPIEMVGDELDCREGTAANKCSVYVGTPSRLLEKHSRNLWIPSQPRPFPGPKPLQPPHPSLVPSPHLAVHHPPGALPARCAFPAALAITLHRKWSSGGLPREHHGHAPPGGGA